MPYDNTPSCTRCSRAGRSDAGPELLLHGPQVPRPDVDGVAEEVRPRRGLLGEELREPAVPLAYVAGPAGGHYVTARVVAPAGARLHVIDAQRLGGEDPAAVH